MSTVLTPRPGTGAVLAWVSTAVRLLLGGVLLAAGGLKMIDPESSVAAVRAYRLLPDGLASVVGWGLPFVEIVLGLLLVAGIAVRPVAVATGALLLVFLAAVVSAAARGLSLDCGCFGGGGPVAAGQSDYAYEIVRDVGLLLLPAWLVRHPHSRLQLGRPEPDLDPVAPHGPEDRG